jgi:hypothetical protein
MRVAPLHLVLERSHHGLGVERALLLTDHDLKGDVQEHVAELTLDRDRIVVSDRLVQLEDFFDEVRS